MTVFGFDIQAGGSCDYHTVVTGAWAFVTTVTTGYFFWAKERAERSVARADKLNQILQRLESDEVATTFYSYVEHNEPVFTNGKFANEKVERSVDKMLNCFSYLCYLKRRRVIARAEFEEFAYWVVRTLSNDQIIDYLEGLYDLYGIEVEERPFHELVRYGRWIGIDRVDVLWTNYMATRPWWERMSDKILCGTREMWRKFRFLGCPRRDVAMGERVGVDAAENLCGFRAYLEQNYSGKSVASIFACAMGVSGLIGKPLSSLATTQEQLARSLKEVDQRGRERWADLSNYRNALKTYFNFANKIPRNRRGSQIHGRYG